MENQAHFLVFLTQGHLSPVMILGRIWQKAPCGSSEKEEVPLDAATMPGLGTQRTPVTVLVVGPLQWP